MPKVRRVAVLGAIALFGAAGCAAEAESAAPQESLLPVARQVPAAGREGIEVQLQPGRAKAGQKVWILANCPIPQGGPEHRGAASSRAFREPVTLDPILATPTPSASGGAAPAARPWVRGQATVAAGVSAGVHDVNVRCEGTNDTGKAALRVTAGGKEADKSGDKPRDGGKPTSTPSSTPKPNRTVISTHAPDTGGGGTAVRDSEDEDMELSFGVPGVLPAAAFAGGAGLGRRRRP